MLPSLALAQDDPSADEIRSGETVEDGVKFDIGDNVIGTPGYETNLSGGTVDQLTFLSGGDDPVTITANLINVALSFLGLLSMLFILYAGYKWFTARDNEEEATQAKQILVGAVIGLAITLTSLGIAQLLFDVIRDSTLSIDQQTAERPWVMPFVRVAYAQEGDAEVDETLEVTGYQSDVLNFDPTQSDRSNTGLATYGDLTPPSVLDLGRADPVTVVLAIVNTLLTLLAMIFLILLVYAGVIWLWARGNEEQIGRSKEIIKRALIGLVIVLAAYGASYWIFFYINYTSRGYL